MTYFQEIIIRSLDIVEPLRLQAFTDCIHVLWWLLTLAGGLALVIALLTVSTQAIRATLANPVKALKYE